MAASPRTALPTAGGLTRVVAASYGSFVVIVVSVSPMAKSRRHRRHINPALSRLSPAFALISPTTSSDCKPCSCCPKPPTAGYIMPSHPRSHHLRPRRVAAQSRSPMASTLPHHRLRHSLGLEHGEDTTPSTALPLATLPFGGVAREGRDASPSTGLAVATVFEEDDETGGPPHRTARRHCRYRHLAFVKGLRAGRTTQRCQTLPLHCRDRRSPPRRSPV